MNSLEQARARVEQAAGLTPLLEASYAAFLLLLPVIEHQQEPGSPWFAAFVMAGGPAASGRFALLGAPSLPEASRFLGFPVPVHRGTRQTAAAVVALAGVLARRLDDGAVAAARRGDRDACKVAARCARDVQARLGGTPLP